MKTTDHAALADALFLAQWRQAFPVQTFRGIGERIAGEIRLAHALARVDEDGRPLPPDQWTQVHPSLIGNAVREEQAQAQRALLGVA